MTDHTDNSSYTTDPRLGRAIWVIALCAVAVGILLTFRSLADRSTVKEKLETRITDMKNMKALERRAARITDAIRTLDELPDHKAVNLSPLLTSTLPGIKPELRESARRGLQGDWSLRRVDIDLGEVALDKFAAFLHKAESDRPPWRLARCTVRSTGTTPGMAQVTLALEALDKKE